MSELNNLRNHWAKLAKGKYVQQATNAWRVVYIPDIEDEYLCEVLYLQSLIEETKRLIDKEATA